MSESKEVPSESDATSQQCVVPRGVPPFFPVMGVLDDFKKFEQAVQRAHSSLLDFGRILYDTIERSYLRHHRRLPGSNRTARLRKKRQTKLQAFWASHRRSWLDLRK
jgi:hypothetical protein